MDKHDRDNLLFLLSSTPEILAEWYATLSDDDIQYAFELLITYKEELKIKDALLKDPKIQSLNQAIDVLQEYRLGKKA